jgi:Kef-type K+ transport system membrane component KefB
MIEQELTGLGILFIFVVVGAIFAVKIKQPIGIGLLLIGALIGPHAFNFVKDPQIINLMIDFGSIILLFIIGLEFSVPKIMKIGFKAIMFGFLKISIIFFLSYETFILLGMSQQIAVLLGVILSISSTVVIIKILDSKGLYEREEMPLLIGVLVIEDIFSVIVLTFLAKLGTGLSVIGTMENIVIAVTILSIAYFITLKISKFIVGWLIKDDGEEIILFLALATCIGFSYLAHFLGLSAATGAFLAGSIVGSLPQVKLFEHAVRPYTLAFSSLFFISIGTMVNFGIFKTHLVLILGMLLLIVISRIIAVGLMGHLFVNFKKEQAIFSSIAMMCIGEFSLLIAQQGQKFNLGIDLVSLAGTLILLTAIIMSLSINHYSKVYDIIETTRHTREFTNKPKSLSRYIQILFDELDIENTNTSHFKKLFFTTLSYAMLALFIFIGWAKLMTLFNHHELSVVYKVLITFVFIAVECFFSYKLYHAIKHMHATLLVIIANTDNSGNTHMCMHIVNNLIFIFFVFIAAICFPAFIVFLHLPVWTNLIPIGVIIAITIKLGRIVRLIDTFHSRRDIFPQYKKFSDIHMGNKPDPVLQTYTSLLLLKK